MMRDIRLPNARNVSSNWHVRQRVDAAGVGLDGRNRRAASDGVHKVHRGICDQMAACVGHQAMHACVDRGRGSVLDYQRVGVH